MEGARLSFLPFLPLFELFVPCTCVGTCLDRALLAQSLYHPEQSANSVPNPLCPFPFLP